MASEETQDNNIAIIGTGYVGIVTGACLASKGFEVTCVDLDTPEGQKKVELINKGLAPIVEDGLDQLISRTVKSGNLQATTDLAKAVKGAGIVLISVGTPSALDGSANTDYVFNAAKAIAEYADPETIVAIRSTVPVGTTRRIDELFSSVTKTKLYPVSNPEFLAEGTAIKDTMKPSRVVIGTDSPEIVGKRMARMWHPFLLNRAEHDFIITDPESSEMVKLNSNFQLALQIIGTNTVAEMCERNGADYRDVQKGTGRDNRIGKFLNPGPGYGGSCFPKDVRALAFLAKRLGVDSEFLKSLDAANEWHKIRWFDKIKKFYGAGLKDRKIAVWGLSFKPGTDDIRESAAMKVIPVLNEHGVKVIAFDPLAKETAAKVLGEERDDLVYASDMYSAAEDVDALLILTDSGEYTIPNLNRLKSKMKTPVIFDARSLYNLQEMYEAGFYYNSNGRRVIDGRQAA